MSESFGIYVHWPYCAAKCPYCDFNSHVRGTRDEARWAKAIARELAFVASLQTAKRPSVSSIFFGGGTPSLMGGAAVAHVLDAIADLWSIDRDAEITLEANPNSVEQERFRDYRAAGVNRLSVGVQALNDRDLKALGRLHGTEEAKKAIVLALKTFPRASFDLIYARPGQSRAQWRAELREALEFGTEHLSLYQLTIEPGTQYATLARQGKLDTPGDDEAADLFDTTQEICEAAGMPGYEVSNHARKGAECRHNLIYWRCGDYAGVGPGAHGRLTLDGKRFASEAERLPERWLAGVELHGNGLSLNEIATADAAREHLLMGLRLAEGIDLAAYGVRWGMQPPPGKIAALVEEELVSVEGTRISATRRGRLLLNSVISELAP